MIQLNLNDVKSILGTGVLVRTTRYGEHAKAFPLEGEGFNLVNGKVNNHP
jgi:hypothetical protein